MRTRNRLGVAVLCACALAAACGGDGADASGTTSSVASDGGAGSDATTSAPTTVETTTTTIDEEEAAILAAVDGYWDAVLAAGNPSIPDDPALARYASGEALNQTVSVLAERQRLGQAVMLPASSLYSHDPQVVEINGSVSTVSDCAVDDSEVFDVETGIVLNGLTATNLWTVKLQQIDGSWTVSSLVIDHSWEGAVPCGE